MTKRADSVEEAKLAFVNQMNELKTRRKWTDEDLRRRLGYKDVRSIRYIRQNPLSAPGTVILRIQQWLREAREEQKAIGYEI